MHINEDDRQEHGIQEEENNEDENIENIEYAEGIDELLG